MYNFYKNYFDINYFDVNYLDKTIYNDKNESTVNEMVEKMTFIIDKTGESNSEEIFPNYRVYVQVINSMNEIEELWRSIEKHSDNMDYMHLILTELQDTINLNIKYYDRSSYNLYPQYDLITEVQEPDSPRYGDETHTKFHVDKYAIKK